MAGSSKRDYSTKRFTDRVEDYQKYRPDYPKEIISFLEEEIDLTEEDEIADMGAGTGISARMFLENGNYVYGIEPNNAMYEKMVQQLSDYSNFSAILSSAEDTELEDSSIDVVIAAQAFHWFHVKKCRSEFHRILRPDGHIVLIWNSRRLDTEFGEVYEQLLLDYAIDYQQVDHKQLGADEFDYLYGKGNWSEQDFPNSQHLDLDGLKGRLRSSSYTPKEDERGYEAMMHEIEAIFDQHAEDGSITIEYTTKVIYGQLS